MRSAAPDASAISPQTWLSYRVQQKLAEPAGAGPPGQHVLRADPQDDDDAGEHQEDHNGGERGARPGRLTGGPEGALDRAGEPRAREPLVGECLQRAGGPDELGRIGRSVGELVLRLARAAAHRATERHQRQHDHRNGTQHEAGKPRARHHHHDRGAQEQHQVAQRDRDRGAHRRLDLRGVRGEPRHHLAGLGRIEERGR